MKSNLRKAHLSGWRMTIYALLTVLVFFGLLEGGLRLFGFSGRADDTRFVLNPEWDYPEYFLKDRELFWRFRPNQVITSDFFVEGEYHINSHGLRGPDFTAGKAPGTVRIICLGNSCTFGWQVGENDPYPRQLETMLDRSAPGRSIQVINAGVTGYTTFQGLRFSRDEVLGWGPDVLVVSYCWNDHWAGAQDIADKDQELPPQWVLDIQNACGRTLTYRWLKFMVFSIRRPVAEFSHTQPVYRVGPADYRDNLEAMIELARSRGIPVILLTSPIPPKRDFPPPMVHAFHEKYNEIMRSFVGQRGVTVLDVAVEFAKVEGLFDNPGADPTHYNVNGHNIIAAMIANYLQSGGRAN